MNQYFYIFYHDDKLSLPLLSHSSNIKENFIRERDYKKAIKELICYYNTKEEAERLLKKINNMSISEIMDSVDSGYDFIFCYSNVAILNKENYKAYKKVLAVWKDMKPANKTDISLEFLTDFITHWAEESFYIPSAETMEVISRIEDIKEKDDLTIHLLDNDEIVRRCAEVKMKSFNNAF